MKMNIGKTLLAGLLVPALIAPSIAAAAVRPSAKAVTASAKPGHSLAVRGSRASATLEDESKIALIGLPLLLVAAAAAVAATVVVATGNGSSPD
jgi:hypothetical protein